MATSPLSASLDLTDPFWKPKITMTDGSILETKDNAYQELMGLPLQEQASSVERLEPVARVPKSKDLKTQAVTKIARKWKSYSMKKTFQWLKSNLQKSV